MGWVFDKTASTYWCDCGGELVINYNQSGDKNLILSCNKKCGTFVQFVIDYPQPKDLS